MEQIIVEFRTPLKVEKVHNNRWRLLDTFVACIHGPSQQRLLCVVPSGFETDFASVPRLPGVYLMVGGLGDRAAVVHDWLYGHPIGFYGTRKDADNIFHAALREEGVGAIKARLMWFGVRLFGHHYWRKK